MAEGDGLLLAVEAAHAAAVDESRWPQALGALAKLFNARAATLEDFGKKPLGLRYFRTFGLPPRAETDYLAHYQRHNPRAEYAFRNLAQPILSDYVLIDERAMDRDPYYAKFLNSIDLRYFMSGQIVDSSDAQAIVSVQRTRRQGHVDSREVELLRRLLPHLRQAYDVSLRLRRAARTIGRLEDALDWLADGAALVDASGRVLYANERFLDVARANDGLRVHNGFVEFEASAARERFAAALGAAARVSAGDSLLHAADFSLSRRDGGVPLVIGVRPLARDRRGPATALVLVHDPLASQSGARVALREAFGLTEAEAHMAEALREGVTPAGYARRREISANTAYTHLRRIKDKTGATNLADLIRRLNEVRAPLRPHNGAAVLRSVNEDMPVLK